MHSERAWQWGPLKRKQSWETEEDNIHVTLFGPSNLSVPKARCNPKCPSYLSQYKFSVFKQAWVGYLWLLSRRTLRESQADTSRKQCAFPGLCFSLVSRQLIKLVFNCAQSSTIEESNLVPLSVEWEVKLLISCWNFLFFFPWLEGGELHGTNWKDIFLLL